MLYDNRRRSAQWLDANEPPKHMPKPNLYPKKIMVSVWSSKGIVHYSFLKQGEAINADKYCQEIDIMYQKLRAQQPALVNRHGALLLHDNTKPHIAKKTVKKLDELKFEVLPHPSYSPDISPTDYHLFKHLDGFLTGKIFQEKRLVKNTFHEFIDSRSSDFFKNGINAFVSRWQKCIEVDGDYFD
ncbi:histone-lysine N-methyltransferase SETMAR-like [Linepithema humile]|uniref:histone-lysine N-methyltransferase SETMAR-like n=1 Tax=Linepithema humile TaxID=83485 RepID=UPI00351EFAAA